MADPILEITDGTNTVDLLGRQGGLLLDEWTPSIAPLKSGGIYRQSVLSGGRQLSIANYDNAIETFELKAWGDNQDATIRHTQDLLSLLEKARRYWVQPFEMDPVWLVAKGPLETNTRYALIYNYQLDGLDNPFSMPFFSCDPAAMDGLGLVIERGHWSAIQPLTSEVVNTTAGDGTNGQNTAADGQSFWADKYNEAAITHIYVDDGGAFGSNQVNSTSFSLFPASPAINDAVYFGISTAGADSGPFNNLVFDIGTGNFQITTTWEFYQGAPTSGWTSFGNFDLDYTDQGGGSSAFSRTGVNGYSFMPIIDSTNGDWTTTTVNSVTGWWIRCRVTAVGGSATVPVTQNQKVYTTTWGHIEIASDEISGDLPALGWIKMYGIGGASSIRAQRVIMGIQSEKGDFHTTTNNFQAYIPLSDEQNPAIVETPYSYIGCSAADDVSAPTGRAVQFNPSTSPDSAYVRITSSTAHFMGRFKVFVRARQDGGVDDNFKVWLEVGYDTMAISEVTKSETVRIQTSATKPNWQLLELGELSIPPDIGNRSKDDVGDVIFEINMEATTSTGDLWVQDLVLIPVDEWFGDFSAISSNNTVSGATDALHMDSIEQPKALVKCSTKVDGAAADLGVIPWKSVVTGPFELPTNVNFKIWFLSARWDVTDDVWVTHNGAFHKVWLEKQERYLGMRGGG
jgi:hypothetical protein